MHFWSFWAKYWHFWPTFYSDLTQTNEIWLRTSTHFCREVGYVVNTRFFGLLFYSDLTQTNEIRLRHDSDIWVKKWRVKPLTRISKSQVSKSRVSKLEYWNVEYRNSSIEMSCIEKSKFKNQESIKSAMLHTSLMSFLFVTKQSVHPFI